MLWPMLLGCLTSSQQVAALQERTYLEVEKYAARDVLASTSLREEGVECVVASTNCLVAGHLSIRLDA